MQRCSVLYGVTSAMAAGRFVPPDLAVLLLSCVQLSLLVQLKASLAVKVISGRLQALEMKSKAYKSPAQASLFLMNNVHYMVCCTLACATARIMRAWVLGGLTHEDMIVVQLPACHVALCPVSVPMLGMAVLRTKAVA